MSICLNFQLEWSGLGRLKWAVAMVSVIIKYKIKYLFLIDYVIDLTEETLALISAHADITTLVLTNDSISALCDEFEKPIKSEAIQKHKSRFFK